MNSASRPSRIALIHEGRHEEGIAGGAVTPGHLVKLDSNGEYIKHATAGGYAEALFALEDALQGGTIDDAYAENDRIFVAVCQKGDVVQAWVAGGEDVETGELLVSNGDGTLQVVASTEIPIAVALEDVDASDSNDADGNERIKVRIL